MALSPAHRTLVPDEILSVDFERDFDTVEVLNRDGTAEVWFTLDGTDPEVEADGTQCLPAGVGSLAVNVPDRPRETVVKLVCASAQRVSVRIVT